MKELEFLTRDYCKELTKNSEVFYCSESIKEGHEVEIYNYRLASYNDFNDNNAFELRGITFINYDGVWKRFLALEKFFNVNQCEAWSENILKTKKIQSVQNKEDGSLIQFIPFEGSAGKAFYAKSKMSFDSDQAKMAQELFDNNSNLRKFVLNAFNDGYTIIFELVSPKNQIVLSYDTTELRVLQIRNLDTGSYLKWDRESISYIESKGLICAAHFNINILESIAEKYTEEELKNLIKDKEFKGIFEFLTFIKQRNNK